MPSRMLGAEVAGSGEQAGVGGEVPRQPDVGLVTQKLSPPTVVTLNATADTYITQATPTLNFGTATVIDVTGVALSGWEAGLVKFDSAAIQSAIGTGTLQSASLQLTINAAALSLGGSNVSVNRMTVPWTEQGATWLCANDTDHSTLGRFINNCTTQNRWGIEWWSFSPRPYLEQATATIPVPFGQTGVVSANVTSDVQALLNGTPHHGWFLSAAATLSSVWVHFVSRQGSAAPKLVLTVASSCTPTGADTGCDGVDDDCNGTIDDAYVSTTTTCGKGVCERTGNTSCVSGSVVDSCAPGAPGTSDTSCNGIDENCNGTTDEGYIAQPTSCGVGACTRMGSSSCVSGTVQTNCSPAAPAAGDVSCDGVDDDCNGVNDEDYVAQVTACGTGACARTGMSVCIGGVVQNNCMAGAPAASDTTCDTVDDNCNGLIDEGYSGAATTCSVAGCSATGSMQCLNGMVTDSCVTSPICVSETACSDGVDNDTDGSTDCADSDCASEAGCLREVCANSLDDDADGLFDCADSDCASHSACTGVPTDPSTQAPQPKLTDAVTTYESTAFLYSGPDPIQRNVTPGTIIPERVAILRGQVRDVANSPLPGVLVRVLGHPEFGETSTRMDGMFDLAVNGGVDYRVVFERPGYLAVQRKVSVNWEQFGFVQPVVMTALDPQGTAVDLGMDGATQVARGSVVSDEGLSRQATLMFSSSVAANMTLPSGSMVPLTQLTVRATEYTVGPHGRAAMPAELPAATAYTYAVELSLDEAMAAGATRVDFSEPVPLYVENFLGFPVGSAVPSGYYDRDRGIWVPAPNGRVVSVVSISAGLANLDVDGDGNADSAAALTALGVTDPERQRVAELYTPGRSLWRVPIDHFSPHDLNWPYGPPENVSYPPGSGSDGNGGDDGNPPVSDDGVDDESPDDDCEGEGSIIRFEEGSLGESIPIAGTSLSLNYNSAYARQTSSSVTTIKIKVLPDMPLQVTPTTITVDVSVAGRRISNIVAPGTQFLTVPWDGRSAFGPVAPGGQLVNVQTCYEYPAVYYPVESARTMAFDNVRGPEAKGALAAVPALSPDRSKIQLCSTFKKVVTTSLTSSMSEAGWEIDQHHSYDPVSRVVYRGDGGTQSVRGLNLGSAISDVYGGRNSPLNLKSGGSSGFMSLPDGSTLIMYGEPTGNGFANAGPRRLLPSGAMVLADSPTYWNKNWSVFPVVSAGPNGSVYMAEFERGSGSIPFRGEVRRYRLDANYNFVQPGTVVATLTQATRGVAVGPEGSIYVIRGADILKTSPDGTSRIFYTFPDVAANRTNTVPIAGSSTFSYAPGVLTTIERPLVVSQTTGTVYVIEQWAAGGSVQSPTVVNKITALPPNGGREDHPHEPCLSPG